MFFFELNGVIKRMFSDFLAPPPATVTMRRSAPTSYYDQSFRESANGWAVLDPVPVNLGNNEITVMVDTSL